MANTNLIIKQLCEERGITITDLAGKLRINRRSLVRALERNKFGIERLEQIADILKVTIPELFEDANTITCPYCGNKIKLNV